MQAGQRKASSRDRRELEEERVLCRWGSEGEENDDGEENEEEEKEEEEGTKEEQDAIGEKGAQEFKLVSDCEWAAAAAEWTRNATLRISCRL